MRNGMTQTHPEKTFARRSFSLRDILFLAVFCLVPTLFGSGCAVHSVISDLGTTRTEFSDYRYEMSPNRDEIVFISKKTKRYNYLPFYNFLHTKPAWTSVQRVKERIPLEPPPKELSRCSLIVEPDPDAPLPRFLAPVSAPAPDDAADGAGGRIMDDLRAFYLFEGVGTSNYADGIFEFTVVTDELPLREGETLHLRVRPAHLQLLNQPFRIRLVRREKETDTAPAVDPDLLFLQEHGIVRIEGNFRRESDDELHLMFPVSVDGDRYELLSSADPGPVTAFRIPAYNTLYPFREKQIGEIENEYRNSGRTPTVEAVCWKILWFPTALVFDVIALPVYVIVIPIDFIFIHPPNR